MSAKQHKCAALQLATVWAAVAAVAALTTGVAAASPPTATNAALHQQRYDDALDQYEVGHFQVAFAEFASLADSGHCEAARMALQMMRYGKSMYAAEFHAPGERVRRWQIQPNCGQAVARR